MRFENKKRPAKMSSVLGACFPPPRIYQKHKKGDVQRAAQIETPEADSCNNKPPYPERSSAGDNIAVACTVVEQSAPETVHSKGDMLVENTPSTKTSTASTSPPVEYTTCTDLSPPPVVELSGVVTFDTFPALLPVPEKMKKTSPSKPRIPYYKSYTQAHLRRPPPQAATEELPRGVYVPPASSPYPSVDVTQDTQVAAEPEKCEPETEVYPNPFKSSCSVMRLSGGLFEEFLKQMDVVLVMFYKGAVGQEGSKESWAKDQFVKAAEMTSLNNHAFAAVDCAKENSICNRQDVTSFPLFRLYSKGHTVDTIKNYQSFDSETMQKFVQFSSVLAHRPGSDSLFSRITNSSTTAQTVD